MLAEAGSGCTNLWCDYVATQFDPAHLLSELGFTIAFELIQLVLIVWLWRKVIKPRLSKQLHDQFDVDHAIEHHQDHIHLDGHHRDEAQLDTLRRQRELEDARQSPWRPDVG